MFTNKKNDWENNFCLTYLFANVVTGNNSLAG